MGTHVTHTREYHAMRQAYAERHLQTDTETHTHRVRDRRRETHKTEKSTVTGREIERERRERETHTHTTTTPNLSIATVRQIYGQGRLQSSVTEFAFRKLYPILSNVPR